MKKPLFGGPKRNLAKPVSRFTYRLETTSFAVVHPQLFDSRLLHLAVFRYNVPDNDFDLYTIPPGLRWCHRFNDPPDIGRPVRLFHNLTGTLRQRYGPKISPRILGGYLQVELHVHNLFIGDRDLRTRDQRCHTFYRCLLPGFNELGHQYPIFIKRIDHQPVVTIANRPVSKEHDKQDKTADNGNLNPEKIGAFPSFYKIPMPHNNLFL